MKILVTGSRPQASAAVAASLRAAGHTLAFCHPEHHASQCAGVGTGAGCPLAGGDIDVVVDARAEGDRMTAHEFGALCALNHGTPLVVAGPVPDQGHPWRDAEVLCAAGDVAAGCQAAVSPIGPSSLRTVRSAAVRVLRQHCAGAELTVIVRTRNGGTDVFVTPDRALPPQVRESIRTVIRATLTPYTADWAHAQVYFSR